MKKRKEKILEVVAVPTHQSLNCLWYKIENADVVVETVNCFVRRSFQ